MYYIIHFSHGLAPMNDIAEKQDSHQDNMSVCFIPLYTPLLYSRTGVYRGIHYFLIFALKHILWVLVRTASMVLTCTTIYVLSKNMKIVKKNHQKIVILQP